MEKLVQNHTHNNNPSVETMFHTMLLYITQKLTLYDPGRGALKAPPSDFLPSRI